MTKEKFSDYIRKQGDEFRKAGDGYEALSDTSKACIDYAVQRFVDEYAGKQQAIAFAIHYAKSAIQNGYVKPSAVDSDRMEDRYNLFIEQQNKP